MTTAHELQSIPLAGWRSGFGPLLRKETRDWWGTRRWWVHTLVWLVLLNGFLGFMYFVMPVLMETFQAAPEEIAQLRNPETGISMFFKLGVTALSIGVIIMAQGAVLDERLNGTLEWLLSKPLSRTALILAKLTALTLVVVVLLIAVQSLTAYGLMTAAGIAPARPSDFLGAIGIMSVNILFFLYLTFAMSTISANRSLVLAVPLVLLLGGPLVTMIVKPAGFILPTVLPDAATLVALGGTLPFQVQVPIIASAAWCLVFVAIALWHFNRQEW